MPPTYIVKSAVKHESVDKRAIKDEIEKMGGFWSCVQGGMGSKPGDPDIVACINGRYVAIECKTPVGRLSKAQKDCRKAVIEAGGVHIVARSKDEFLEAISLNGLIKTD